MEDASLDEFFESNDPGSGDAEPNEAPDAEPATTTMRWTGADECCRRCETTTSRLWADDGTLVCQNCKDW